MQSIAKAIQATKTHYKHLLLLSALFFSLPTGTIHTTSMKQETYKTQKTNINTDLDDEKDPEETIIEDTKQEKKTDNPSFDVEKLQYFIKTAIEEVEKYETKLQNNEMVYFYGNTGSGKSTIINYLLGNELEKYYPEDEKNLHTNEKDTDDQNNTNTQSDSDSDDLTCAVKPKEEKKIFRIRHKDPNAIGPKIGQNFVKAETTYPCPYFPQDNYPLGYCDTAGFGDNRGIENIVCSYIGNNLIINKSEKLKAICFVTYKNALEIRRGQPFLDNVISTISNLVKKTEDCNPLDSIFILLNNKSQIDNAAIVSQVFKMLNTFKKGFKKSKQEDQQNAPKYENYINILKKILKDSTSTKTIRILAINPLDQGESRKAFLDRISTSPIIPKQNLKKLASKQGEEKVRWLQKEMLQQTEPILNTILQEQKSIEEKREKASKIDTQIQKLNKEKEDFQRTIQDLQKQSQDIKKKQQELEQKITNTKKQHQKIQKQIDELELKKTSSDYNKETEKLLSQYDHMINNQKERISKLEKKQNNIHTEIKRYQHKIEDKNEQIDKLALQLKKEKQQIDQLNKEKKHLLDNTTQKQIIALAQQQKNWFDYYQNLLNPISNHWAKTMLETNIFKDLQQKITTQLQACNSTCRTLQGHISHVSSVAFNPQGDLLASGSSDKTIKIWNTTNWQCTKTLQGHKGWVYSIAFHPQGHLLASASSDNTIKLWNTTNWQCTKTLQGHKGSVISVAFNPQGDLLASASSDNTIKFWNTTNWQCTRTLEGHKGSVNSVAFNPQGNLLASGSEDETIKFWNTTNWQCTKTLEGHKNSVNSVAFNPQVDLLASASKDKAIKLWNTTNGQCTTTLQGNGSFLSSIFNSFSFNSVAFNPQGDLLASASKTINLWDTTNGQCKKTLKGHTYSVSSVTFNPQGTLLASASNDRTVKFWDIPTLLGHKTSKYHLFNLDKDQFKLKTDPHLKKITEILSHYYKETVQTLQNSDAQKKKKTLQTQITNQHKKMHDQKQEETNLQKEIDSLNSTIDSLENKKFQQIQTQLKNKKNKDQLDYYIRQKEKIYTMLDNLQQDRTQQYDILNDIFKQRFQDQTKHEYLLEKMGIIQGNYQDLSDQLNRHQKELIAYQGILKRKQPSIELILKIDSIVPMGLIAYSFIQKYMQCKMNNKHM